MTIPDGVISIGNDSFSKSMALLPWLSVIASQVLVKVHSMGAVALLP